MAACPVEISHYIQNVEKFLMETFGLSNLRSGHQVLRDENGWRQNEKMIDYIWIVLIDRFSVGAGGIFAIKFDELNFREFKNPEELVGGIFRINAAGECTNLYHENNQMPFHDRIMTSMRFDLFDANKGITLDGITYNMRIMCSNIDTTIKVSNPNTESWKNCEIELFAQGRALSLKSEKEELIALFK
jgi:hypothetical protein